MNISSKTFLFDSSESGVITMYYVITGLVEIVLWLHYVTLFDVM